MKIIILGSQGMLGFDLVRVAQDLGHTVYSFPKTLIDISEPQQILEHIEPLLPVDFLINCAAFTHVDLCESQAETAFSINCLAVQFLATLAQVKNIPFIHFSTDYVFPGEGSAPYNETMPCEPINVYGASKLEGERAIESLPPHYYIFRLQWLYGDQGAHFVRTILNLAKDQSSVQIVNDQWGSPSWTYDIARCLLSFLEKKPPYGIYHLTNQGYTTWYDFAHYIFQELGLSCQIEPIQTPDMERPAPRPLNCRLDTQKFLSVQSSPPLSWQESISEFLRIR